jgi:Zn-dependent protease
VSGRRDPRAWRIDEDPFDKLESRKAPPSHSSARDDSTRRNPHVRVVFSSTAGGNPFFRVFGQEQQPISSNIHKGSIWHFSEIEVEHLIQATMAFTIALAFMGTGGILGAITNIQAFVISGFIYFLALSPAFVLHELAHKFSAKSYGCWAEFRASPSGLRFGVFLAALTGIVFMAPGAVMVVGNTTKSQFGKIALAGPVTNVVLWLIGLLAVLIGMGEVSILNSILTPWMWGNAFLGTFNMLPFGPLDGRKIKTWSDGIFWVWMIICLSLLWFNIEYLPDLL